MTALPLSLIGVLLALLITNDTLNMVSMIGVIIAHGARHEERDSARRQRERAQTRWRRPAPALVEAGRVRLRPTIMTTAAMIFGMLPIALSLGEGGGFRAPMARAVIGGLIASTMLTLIVVPVAYTYFDDVGAWFKRRFVSEQRERAMKAEAAHAGIGSEPAWNPGPPTEARFRVNDPEPQRRPPTL